jgi:hypothetical protein
MGNEQRAMSNGQFAIGNGQLAISNWQLPPVGRLAIGKVQQAKIKTPLRIFHRGVF